MRRFKATTILSDAKVRAVATALSNLLPPGISLRAHAVSSLETSIRMRAVAEMTRERRTAAQRTIQQVATELKVPQYRLRAIESGHLSEVQASILRKYIAFLDLDAWFARWLRANRTLAAELGFEPRS